MLKRLRGRTKSPKSTHAARIEQAFDLERVGRFARGDEELDAQTRGDLNDVGEALLDAAEELDEPEVTAAFHILRSYGLLGRGKQFNAALEELKKLLAGAEFRVLTENVRASLQTNGMALDRSGRSADGLVGIELRLRTTFDAAQKAVWRARNAAHKAGVTLETTNEFGSMKSVLVVGALDDESWERLNSFEDATETRKAESREQAPVLAFSEIAVWQDTRESRRLLANNLGYVLIARLSSGETYRLFNRRCDNYLEDISERIRHRVERLAAGEIPGDERWLCCGAIKSKDVADRPTCDSDTDNSSQANS